MRKFEYKYKVDEEHGVVVALSTYAGKAVSGVARCAPNDTFDVEVGKKIAAARCDVKIATKRKKRAESCLAFAREMAEYWNKKVADTTKYVEDSTVAYEKALEDVKIVEQF